MSVAIICNIALVRAMLASVCESAGFSVSASCETADDLLELGDRDVALLQVFQEGREAGRAVAYLRTLSSFAPIALIAPDKTTERLQMELGAKVSAIIPESVTALDLFTSSLKMVANGYRLMPGNALMNRLAHHDEVDPAERETSANSMLDLLSKREVAILTRLCDGLPNKTIAKELGISEGTVKVHLRTIFRKTGVNNRTQAALWGTGRL